MRPREEERAACQETWGSRAGLGPCSFYALFFSPRLAFPDDWGTRRKCRTGRERGPRTGALLRRNLPSVFDVVSVCHFLPGGTRCRASSLLVLVFRVFAFCILHVFSIFRSSLCIFLFSTTVDDGRARTQGKRIHSMRRTGNWQLAAHCGAACPFAPRPSPGKRAVRIHIHIRRNTRTCTYIAAREYSVLACLYSARSSARKARSVFRPRRRERAASRFAPATAPNDTYTQCTGPDRLVERNRRRASRPLEDDLPAQFWQLPAVITCMYMYSVYRCYRWPPPAFSTFPTFSRCFSGQGAARCNGSRLPLLGGRCRRVSGVACCGGHVSILQDMYS